MSPKSYLEKDNFFVFCFFSFFFVLQYGAEIIDQKKWWPRWRTNMRIPYISHQCKFLQTFSPILWIMEAKLQRVRGVITQGEIQLRLGGKHAADLLTKDDRRRHQLKMVEERWKDWAGDVHAYLCSKSCECKWCHGWRLFGKNKYRCPLVYTWGCIVYPCGSTRTTRNTVNSFYLTVGLSKAFFHL